MRAIIHAKSEPLSLKANNTRASRPDHLDPSPIIESHLAEAMDHITRAQDISDAPPFAGP